MRRIVACLPELSIISLLPGRESVTLLPKSRASTLPSVVSIMTMLPKEPNSIVLLPEPQKCRISSKIPPFSLSRLELCGNPSRSHRCDPPSRTKLSGSLPVWYSFQDLRVIASLHRYNLVMVLLEPSFVAEFAPEFSIAIFLQEISNLEPSIRKEHRHCFQIFW